MPEETPAPTKKKPGPLRIAIAVILFAFVIIWFFAVVIPTLLSFYK